MPFLCHFICHLMFAKYNGEKHDGLGIMEEKLNVLKSCLVLFQGG